MNKRCLNIVLIRDGLKYEDTIILETYTTGSVVRVRPLYEKDLPIFKHITGAAFEKIDDFETDHAKIFLFHNFNVVAFDETGKTKLLYKKDGTIITYEE